MSDFGFYGESNDDYEEKEIQGITGDVTSFTFVNLEYPCIIFNEGFTCPKHQLTVIGNMVKSTNALKDISLYFLNGGELFKIGMIGGIQVNAFLEIVGTDNVTGYFDKDTKLENSLLYSLCTVL